MKKEFKFLISVVSILLVSSLILAGCMQALSESNGESKDYDMNIVSEIIAESKPETDTDEPPMTQTDMKEKFSSMYGISENGKSITVITEEYLNSYWSDGKRKNKALTSEEVLYIIQDSIRIYFEYDEYVLIGTEELASIHGNLVARYPLLNSTLTLSTKSKEDLGKYYVAVCQEIHYLIVYRLAALSTPDAFIFADEALQAYGSLSDFKSTYVQSIFYVPKDAPTKDYSTLARFICGNIVDFEQIGIFDISYYGDTRVIHYSGGEGTAVFPTAEMKSSLPCRVVAIEDRSAGKVLAWAEQTFYSDEKFEYKFPALMSWYIYAILDDGTEMHLTEALQNGYIAPKDFPNFDFPYYRSYKRKEVQQTAPYFRDIAVYTDKLAPKEYPCANLITDSAEFMRYHTTIQNGNLFNVSRGTPDAPSFTEVYWSYDGPWFYDNNIIMVHIEADSECLPEVASIIFEEKSVEVIFKQESLGNKKDQLYTIFIETHKFDIANEFGIEHIEISSK